MARVLLEINPDVKQGTIVFAGTRISLRHVLGRLRRNDDAETVAEDTGLSLQELAVLRRHAGVLAPDA